MQAKNGQFDEQAAEECCVVDQGNVHKWRPMFFGHFWPTYHVRRFLPYNVRYVGAFLDHLPTLKFTDVSFVCIGQNTKQTGEKIVTWHKREI